MCPNLSWGVPAGVKRRELFRERSKFSTRGPGRTFAPRALEFLSSFSILTGMTDPGIPWKCCLPVPTGMLSACEEVEDRVQVQASQADLCISSSECLGQRWL